MTEPSTLLGRTIRAIGAKKVARLWGFSLGYVYSLARDPADPEHPDNSGTEADPDTRRRDLLEALASHPRHRPLLKEWRLRDEALYARLLESEDPLPMTDERVIQHAASCSKESGEGVESALRAAIENDCAEQWRGALSEVTEAEAELHALGLAIHPEAGRPRGRDPHATEDRMTELPLFSPEATRQATTDAIERSDANTREAWRKTALEAVRQMAEDRQAFLVDDLWRAGLEKPDDARRIGPVLLRAERKGWIEKAPHRRASDQPQCHGNQRRVWRSRLYAPNQFEASGRESKARHLARAVWKINSEPGVAERAAALKPEEWAFLARMTPEVKNPPSEATIARVIDLLQLGENQRRAG